MQGIKKFLKNSIETFWLLVKESWRLWLILLVRTALLALAAWAGLEFAIRINRPLLELLNVYSIGADDMQWGIGSVHLAVFLMYLPVLYVLWHFRTTDTQKNLDKAQGSLNANLLGLYLKMLFSKDLKEKYVGLIRLADLKQQGIFTKEIDSATRQRLVLTDLKILRGEDIDGMTTGHLQGENLSGVNLEGAHLNKVNLENTNLSGAFLRHVNMQEARLIRANIEGAKLFRAELQHANLEKARLQGADMRAADLSEADLQGANLENADLRGADLSSAKNLDKAILTGAKFDDLLTKFPDGFSPNRHKMKAVPIEENGGSA